MAIGDLHGGYEAAVTLLRQSGLVDDELRWSGGEDCLVQLGDIVDRGARSRELLELMMRLEQDSSGQAMMLLGNHEVLNLVGELSYVDVGEFAAYRDLEQPAARKRGLREFKQATRGRGWSDAQLQTRFAAAYPPGWFGHRAAFERRGRYGAWLLQRPVALVVDGTLFVHGGLKPGMAAGDVDAMNRIAVEEIRQFDQARRRLIRAGWLGSLDPFAESVLAVERRLERLGQSAEAGAVDPLVRRSAETLARLGREGLTLRDDGPCWWRGWAQGSDAEVADDLEALRESLGVRRVVIAHTTLPDGTIRSRLDGRLFLIDTGAGAGLRRAGVGAGASPRWPSGRAL